LTHTLSLMLILSSVALQAADAAVAACPIDTRRSLYGSVALAGGAAATKNLRRRLAAELSALANARVHASARVRVGWWSGDGGCNARVHASVRVKIEVKRNVYIRYCVPWLRMQRVHVSARVG
jgi:actin-related protein